MRSFCSTQEGENKANRVGGVNPHAGVLDRFLQFGESSRSTKTAGFYGEGNLLDVSFVLLGNAHPEVMVPMERGEVGSHTGQTKERMSFYMAPRVQPHDALPEG